MCCITEWLVTDLGIQGQVFKCGYLKSNSVIKVNTVIFGVYKIVVRP